MQLAFVRRLEGKHGASVSSRTISDTTSNDPSAAKVIRENMRKRIRRRNQYYSEPPSSPSGSARSTSAASRKSGMSSVSSSDDMNASSGSSTDGATSVDEDDDAPESNNAHPPKKSPAISIHGGPGLRGLSAEGNVSTSFLDDYCYGFIDFETSEPSIGVECEQQPGATGAPETASETPANAHPLVLPHSGSASRIADEDWSDLYAYFYEDDANNGGLPGVNGLKSLMRRSMSNLSQLI
jgi:hypothetical protein